MRFDGSSWFEEDDDLQVFVPGLMATGILVSIVMLLWDGVKRFLPDLGRRRRAARLSMQTSGRINDLVSIELGEAPSFTQVERVRRSRGAALLLAVVSSVSTATVSLMTLAAYQAGHGPLAGRGWTLTVGMSAAGAFGLLTTTWLFAALGSERLPAWVERAQGLWPVGALPEPSEDDR